MITPRPRRAGARSKRNCCPTAAYLLPLKKPAWRWPTISTRTSTSTADTPPSATAHLTSSNSPLKSTYLSQLSIFTGPPQLFALLVFNPATGCRKNTPVSAPYTRHCFFCTICRYALLCNSAVSNKHNTCTLENSGRKSFVNKPIGMNIIPDVVVKSVRSTERTVPKDIVDEYVKRVKSQHISTNLRSKKAPQIDSGELFY